MKKVLLINPSDYNKMTDDEWLPIGIPRPLEYPCVAVIKNGHRSWEVFVEYVYLKDFD